MLWCSIMDGECLYESYWEIWLMIVGLGWRLMLAWRSAHRCCMALPCNGIFHGRIEDTLNDFYR